MLEVLGPHAVRQVDVTADFTLLLLVSDEQDRGQSSIAKGLFTLCKSLKEWFTLNWATLVSESFDLSGVLVFSCFFLGLLTLSELLVAKHF